MNTELENCFCLKETNTRKCCRGKCHYCQKATHSVRRHSTTIRLYDFSVQKILHKDVNFHPYKTAVLQELNYCEMANLRISYKPLLSMLNDDAGRMM
jgi:hypothetical protein